MDKVALVTGSNQGLGFALVEALCKKLGSNSSVYLTARDESRGKEAVQKLRDQGLSPCFHLLDVTDDSSVSALVKTIQARHGGIDILISNAAARIYPNLKIADQVRVFINTNNHGTNRIIRAFKPLLRENARFVVVASGFGVLSNIHQNLHNEFDVTNRDLADIDRLMEKYIDLVESGQAEANYWPEWINIPSKVAQVASVKILARQMKDEATSKGILINAVCPGLVDTDASRPWFDDMSSAQSPSQAAIDLIWLATLPHGEKSPYGELIQHRKILPWI